MPRILHYVTIYYHVMTFITCKDRVCASGSPMQCIGLVLYLYFIWYMVLHVHVNNIHVLAGRAPHAYVGCWYTRVFDNHRGCPIIIIIFKYFIDIIIIDWNQ